MEGLSLPFVLHTPTILLVGCFVGLAGSVILARAYGSLAEGGAALPRIWLAVPVVQSAVALGNAFRGMVPDWVPFIVVNSAQMLALGLLWTGAARLGGRQVPGWLAGLPVLAWLLAAAMPAFLSSPMARLGLIMGLTIAVFSLTLLELARLCHRERLRAGLDLMAMMIVVLVLLLGQSAWLVQQRADLVPPWGLLTSGSALAVALFGTTLPFLMLAIGREREHASEVRQRAAALEAGRDEVKRLHEGLPAILFLREVAPDGTIRLDYRGGDVEAVTGWPAAMFGDAPLDPHVAPGDARVATIMQHALRDGSTRVDWRLRQPDGGFRHMRTFARVLRRLPGGSAEIAGYTLDVTAERRAEARALAASRLASLGEMGAGLAHELKQPLQALSLAAEVAVLALARHDTATAAERLRVVTDEALRAAGIIDHLRRFASDAPSDAGPQPIPLAEPVEGVLRLIRGALLAIGAEVEVTLGTPSPVVLGERFAFEQVLMNLILNARDALAGRPPGAARRLRIAAEAGDDGWVELHVADTGGGIAAEILPRLFEPFATTKGPDRGTGLGLAVCYGLMRRLSGSIAGRNDDDGAVFTLRLRTAEAGG